MVHRRVEMGRHGALDDNTYAALLGAQVRMRQTDITSGAGVPDRLKVSVAIKGMASARQDENGGDKQTRGTTQHHIELKHGKNSARAHGRVANGPSAETRTVLTLFPFASELWLRCALLQTNQRGGTVGNSRQDFVLEVISNWKESISLKPMLLLYNGQLSE